MIAQPARAIPEAELPCDDPTVRLGSADGRFSAEMISLILEAISGETTFKALIQSEIAAQGCVFTSYPELLGFIERAILAQIRGGEAALGFDPFEVRESLSRYRLMVNESQDAFVKTTKPRPEALFWPSLERDPPISIFDTLPWVENVGLVSKETPIGSAGSCFASEIAQHLQDRGFNYVITEEEAEDASAGVFHHGFDPSRRQARFSANYGLLFNTPSFRQLAEKAFDVRHPRRVVVPLTHETRNGEQTPVFCDPFRQSVAFHSVDAYEANYQKHVSAVREALLKCKVFVITMGLNECWEFVPDGSVMAHNPMVLDLYPLVRRRVLTVEENVANIQAMIDIVRAHNPGFKVIISVSPVPCAITVRARQYHVVAANGHSKAVLRVAADRLVEANRDVFYFPSYETVTVCSESPFTSDQRHVREPAIENVMRLFHAMFVC